MLPNTDYLYSIKYYYLKMTMVITLPLWFFNEESIGAAYDNRAGGLVL